MAPMHCLTTSVTAKSVLSMLRSQVKLLLKYHVANGK
jgi:hypothetical protein